jgi:hypothetical protein
MRPRIHVITLAVTDLERVLSSTADWAWSHRVSMAQSLLVTTPTLPEQL